MTKKCDESRDDWLNMQWVLMVVVWWHHMYLSAQRKLVRRFILKRQSCTYSTSPHFMDIFLETELLYPSLLECWIRCGYWKFELTTHWYVLYTVLDRHNALSLHFQSKAGVSSVPVVTCMTATHQPISGQSRRPWPQLSRNWLAIRVSSAYRRMAAFIDILKRTEHELDALNARKSARTRCPKYDQLLRVGIVVTRDRHVAHRSFQIT